MKKTSLAGSVMLFMAALVWGLAFVAQRYGAGLIDSISLNEVRYIIGAAVLVPVFLILDAVKKKRGDEVLPFNRDTVIGGALCGVILMVSTMSQQFGLETTSAGKAGFITALYIVIVPVMGLLARRRTPMLSWFAIVIALFGFWLMCVTDDFSINAGDLLVLGCAFTFSFQIIFIDVFAGTSDPIKFTFVQFATCAVCGFPLMAANGFPTWSAIESCWIPLVYMGVLSSGFAYTMQVAGQKKVSPEIATLIMSLESVFALLGGAVILKEENSVKVLVGCMLVFVAVFLAQTEIPRKFLKFRNNKFFVE